MNQDDNERARFDALRRQFAPIDFTRDTIGGERGAPYELRQDRGSVLAKANEESPSPHPTNSPALLLHEPEQLTLDFMENGNV